MHPGCCRLIRHLLSENSTLDDVRFWGPDIVQDIEPLSYDWVMYYSLYNMVTGRECIGRATVNLTETQPAVCRASVVPGAVWARRQRCCARRAVSAARRG